MSATPLERLGKDAIEEKGWVAAYKWLILRRVSQLGTLILFLLGPWLGVWLIKGNLSSSLILDTVPLTDPLLFLQILAAGFFGVAQAALIGAAIVAAFYFLVGGRVYCSWVCPVNIVTDLALWTRRKLGIKQSAKLKASTRYWMLAAVIVVSAATGTLAFELVNPVSIVHRSLIFGLGFGTVLIAAIFLFDVFVARHGWCGHLCPMGAFYGLLGTWSPVRVRADNRDACDDCMECYEVCPEPQVIPPAIKGGPDSRPVILSAACTNCGRCIDICPNHVYAFGLRNMAFVAPKAALPDKAEAPSSPARSEREKLIA